MEQRSGQALKRRIAAAALAVTMAVGAAVPVATAVADDPGETTVAARHTKSGKTDSTFTGDYAPTHYRIGGSWS